MRRITPLAVVAVSVVGALAVSGAPEAGATTRASTKLKITGYEPEFQNLWALVSSPRRSCEKGRKVAVHRRLGGSSERVDTDRADFKAEAGWTAILHVGTTPGVYYAVAKRKVAHRHGRRIVCKGSRSKNFSHTVDS